ncbi:MAG: M-phase phosphoprotein 6 [Marteilia pararefringens]
MAGSDSESSMAKKPKTFLSKTLKNMKFMKRIRSEKQIVEEEENERLDEMLQDQNHFFYDHGLDERTFVRQAAVMSDVNYQRVSFNGMNPEIEILMKSQQNNRDENYCNEEEKSVDSLSS